MHIDPKQAAVPTAEPGHADTEGESLSEQQFFAGKTVRRKDKIIEMAILRLAVFPAILIIAAFKTAWCRSGAGST